ncbi:MAG TPA: hypothetical protein VFB68_08120 [Xanthobacteraceae bacterium]|nr:hypothetical protein [Xanthobacteraceae bacterium]
MSSVSARSVPVRSSAAAERLPSRFPVGTRFVIEGKGGRIHKRYVEFPDGRQVALPLETPPRTSSRRRRPHRAGSRK